MGPRGGGDGGTAEASPSELQKAGQGFLALSNACGGMAETGDLQAGGQYEMGAVQFVGGPGMALPGGFNQAVEAVAQGFLGAMISAQQQFADAAMDLFQVAGDFSTADGQIPPGARPMKVLNLPPGITAYIDPVTGGAWYKDSDGTVVADTNASGKVIGAAGAQDATNNPYEQVVGQTYRPAGG